MFVFKYAIANDWAFDVIITQIHTCRSERLERREVINS